MGKHLAKYMVLVILLYLILGGGWHLFSSGVDVITNKATVVILIEASYNLKDEWLYRVEKEIKELQEKYKDSNLEIYYFDDYTYEPISQDIQGNFILNQIIPINDVINYNQIAKFRKAEGKSIDFLIGSKKLKKYAKGSKVIAID